MGDNVPYAQFGKAIARVGDLNKDGFQGTVNCRHARDLRFKEMYTK